MDNANRAEDGDGLSSYGLPWYLSCPILRSVAYPFALMGNWALDPRCISMHLRLMSDGNPDVQCVTTVYHNRRKFFNQVKRNACDSSPS